MSDPTRPVLWVESDGIALGPLRADLVAEYWRWENDPRTVLGYGRQLPESLESRTEGLNHQLHGYPDQARFTVYETADAQPTPVGLASLLIDHQVRTAEFIIVIAPEAQGRRIGTMATRLTLDYAFHLIGLRMVWLKVLEPNTAGIRAYEKAGFQHAGRLRDSGYWLGRPCAEVLMDAVAADFSGPSAITDLITDQR
ncbi:GNAT family N-acetyltransferase [Streptomonospora sp. S1-112]|uniref:GNAT family N-acetyltransferase n=1 Tax=Streptomonospora mangrovi TaxID=2883123 RepID=A0A9X3NYJ7_9ACTN|nr:GNAT family protein [Streptomonospora mangrovi]MDA0566766.1 GNAT family N-acetyltransferase [Streptomonospora mangrovi]